MILLAMVALMAVLVLMARGGDMARAQVVTGCQVVVVSDGPGWTVTVNLLATGPGLDSAPAVTFDVDWGDTTSDTFTGMPGGPNAQEAFPPPHTYPAPGMYTIKLTVDGCNAVDVTVSPAAPSDLKAVPRYGADQKIILTWTDNSNDETGFKIERKDAGPAFAQVGQVGAGVTTFQDTVADTSNHTYRVRVFNNDGDSGPSNEDTTSRNIVWPRQDGTHDMLTGYGDGSSNVFKFHEGIDILGKNKAIVAPRGGIVQQNAAAAGGTVAIKVDVGGGNFEYDVHLHLKTRTFNIGDAVAPGEKIGDQNEAAFGGGVADKWLHYHYSVLSSFDTTGTRFPTFGVSDDGSNLLNPFLRFLSNADRDPQGEDPGLEDNDKDDKTLLFKRVQADGKTFMEFVDPHLFGRIDILAEAFDDMTDMTTTIGHNQGVHAVGYYVVAVKGGGSGVKNAASPFILAKFDDDWFSGDPPVESKHDDIVYETLPLPTKPTTTDAGYPFGKVFNHYIVTNTTGTGGQITDLDTGQFWRTKAEADTFTVANGSDGSDALINKDAAFKDGDYAIHIITKDVLTAHDQDESTNVIVDNFRPYVRKVKGGQSDKYLADWSLSGSNLVFTISVDEFFFVDQATTVTVDFSEPVKEASVTAKIVGQPITGSLDTTGMIWTGTIPPSTLAPGTHTLTVVALDLADNELLAIGSTADIDPATNLTRDETTGIMLGTGGSDTVHRYNFHSATATATATATSTSTTTATATSTPTPCPACPTPTSTPTPTPGPVGGIALVDSSDSPASPADGSDSSALQYAALAGAAGILAVAAGGWYARRRWLG